MGFVRLGEARVRRVGIEEQDLHPRFRSDNVVRIYTRRFIDRSHELLTLAVDVAGGPAEGAEVQTARAFVLNPLHVGSAPSMPLGRWGDPDDAARLVAWLCSDDAAWITGQVIDSEGGFRR